MNNSTLSSTTSGGINGLYSDGPADGGREIGIDAEGKRSQGDPGPRIAQMALQSIGMSTRNFGGPFTSHPEYAAAVSLSFTKATNQAIILGADPGHALSTSLLCNSLLHDNRFKQVPMDEAGPGDIIIASGGHQAGYAGIVVDHGRIVSMGTSGTVENNSSLFEIQRSRQPMAIFRYIGVQKHRSYPLANAGYNPNEPRIPARQPGGGQWTSTGAGTKALPAAKPAPAPTPGVQQRQINPRATVAQRLPAGDDDDNNPRTVGQAAKETAQAFLSGLVSFLRGTIFPSEPDPEPSKPKSIFQLAKDLDQMADDVDMTKPKGLGHAMAAGAIIGATEALSEVETASAPKPKPSGLNAISEAKARVQASSDAYGNPDAQNMGKRRDYKTEDANTTEKDAATLKPYSEGSGHHIPAKSAFTGDTAYDPDTALAIPNSELATENVSHSAVTGAQQSLYRAYAQRGQPLTWEAVQSIETRALTKGGMNPTKAAATVRKAINALKASGVNRPTRIPWGGN